ncbi:solute carrier organic anion transporter family member 2A1-like [Mya arenaria]|uniref:solute carrier organic anion transporter family member 2A1-like n=1 Tax=Mya arenaria TaxID=6604 RepID=UPI0022DF18E1|nr:solute carrier organic anion transporter family member 2A1-like [Mya arenaria]
MENRNSSGGWLGSDDRGSNGHAMHMTSNGHQAGNYDDISNGIVNPNFISETETTLGKDTQINADKISVKSVKCSGKDDDSSKIDSDDDNDFKSLVPFCLVFGIGSLFSQSITVYLSSQITVLERAFSLSSTQSGILLSANDLGFVVTVLLVSHFLKNFHIPRVLSGCMLMFGVSGLLTSLPHFFADYSHAASGDKNINGSRVNKALCLANDSYNQECSLQTGARSAPTPGQKNDWFVIFIGLMMLLQGVAKAPRSSLTTLYIDNNSSKRRTGFYIGLLSSFTIFGPFVAIIVGGLFNKIPVDLQDNGLSPEDPRWIGAWWLGFLVFGGGACLVAGPVFCLPASLRRRPPAPPTEYANTAAMQRPVKQDLVKDLPKSVWRVLRTALYLCTVTSLLTYLFGAMAFGSFGPKYIEHQFHLPTWKANIVMGIDKLVTMVVGTFGGGIITRRLGLGLTGCARMVLVCRIIVFLLGCFNFLFGCPNPEHIVGLSLQNGVAVVDDFSAGNSSMPTLCDCSGASYVPVCADGQTFFSPCHAGCIAKEPSQMYANCSGTVSGQADPGICATGCSMLIPYVAVSGIASLIGTSAIAPIFIIVLRSVEQNDRAMAVGLMSFLMSLVVFLPAPMVYGKIFDSFCSVWTSKCGAKGACSLYDTDRMRYQLVGTSVGLAGLSLVLTAIAVWLADRRTADDGRRASRTLEVKPPVPQPRPSLTSIMG